MTQAPRKPHAVKFTKPASPVSAQKPAEAKPAQHEDVHIDELDAFAEEVRDQNDLEEGLLRRKKRPLRRLLWWSITALTGLIVGLAAEQFISDLFAQNTLLGWIASGIIATIIFALFAMGTRELLGLLRLNKLSQIQMEAQQAHVVDALDKAQKVANQLDQLYQNHPLVTPARQKISAQKAHLFDGRDLIDLYETELVARLDTEARNLIAESARRVSVVTAISPRALLDVLYVAYESIKLVRQLAQLYGGKPGGMALWRLSGSILAQLAITGGVGMSDGLVQQLTGQGIAAKLSKKLGEGIINGLLTARIGIAAMRSLRPLPFRRVKQPVVMDFMGELVSWHKLGAQKEPKL